MKKRNEKKNHVFTSFFALCDRDQTKTEKKEALSQKTGKKERTKKTPSEKRWRRLF
jgi:hypothetical protein